MKKQLPFILAALAFSFVQLQGAYAGPKRGTNEYEEAAGGDDNSVAAPGTGEDANNGLAMPGGLPDPQVGCGYLIGYLKDNAKPSDDLKDSLDLIVQGRMAAAGRIYVPEVDTSYSEDELQKALEAKTLPEKAHAVRVYEFVTDAKSFPKGSIFGRYFLGATEMRIKATDASGMEVQTMDGFGALIGKIYPKDASDADIQAKKVQFIGLVNQLVFKMTAPQTVIVDSKPVVKKLTYVMQCQRRQDLIPDTGSGASQPPADGASATPAAAAK